MVKYFTIKKNSQWLYFESMYFYSHLNVFQGHQICPVHVDTCTNQNYTSYKLVVVCLWNTRFIYLLLRPIAWAKTYLCFNLTVSRLVLKTSAILHHTLFTHFSRTFLITVFSPSSLIATILASNCWQNVYRICNNMLMIIKVKCWRIRYSSTHLWNRMI